MKTSQPLARDYNVAGQIKYAYVDKWPQSKKHHDRKLHLEPKFVLHQWVFVKKKAPSNSARNLVDWITIVNYYKFQPSKAGRFWITKEQPLRFVIDIDGGWNTVSIRRVAAAPTSESNNNTPGPGSAQQSSSSQTMSDSSSHRDDWVLNDASSKKNLQTEHVAGSVVGQNSHDWRQWYIVRWYGYGLENNILEPTKRVARYFITRCNE